ncbi:hypothetical protein [Bradyrhizobium niftali]|uniref:hypothetical protein n=1 Tax=Bradyrhizobium niftali TaxID=2560055 RepID=UPI00384B3C07
MRVIALIDDPQVVRRISNTCDAAGRCPSERSSRAEADWPHGATTPLTYRPVIVPTSAPLEASYSLHARYHLVLESFAIFVAFRKERLDPGGHPDRAGRSSDRMHHSLPGLFLSKIAIGSSSGPDG